MKSPTNMDPNSKSWTHSAAIANPNAPGATYVEADADSIHAAVVSILDALRSAGIIST